MKEIKVLIQDSNGNQKFKNFQGEIYKGFGIIYWSSFGQRPFTIHIPSGKIIAELTGKNWEELIDNATVDPNMDYDELVKAIKI